MTPVNLIPQPSFGTITPINYSELSMTMALIQNAFINSTKNRNVFNCIKITQYTCSCHNNQYVAIIVNKDHPKETFYDKLISHIKEKQL